MGMYENFQTDKKVEVDGREVDFGDFRVTIARAGGANKAYQKALEAKTKPLQRVIAVDALDNEKAMDLLKELFSEHIVRNWEVKNEDDEWQQGIEGPNGEVLEFSQANVLATFRALPAVWELIHKEANAIQIFKSQLREQLGED